MDWLGLVNTLDYYVMEKRLTPWLRSAQRWTSHQRRGWASWGQAWRTRLHAHHQRQEATPMPTEVEKAALFKAMLPQLDADFLTLLKAELRQDLLDELRPEALTQAKAELEAAYARRVEQLEDDYAARRAQVQQDADAELASTLDRERRELRRLSQGEVEGLRDDVRQAETRRAASEGALLHVWQALLPEGRQVYLHDAGVRELDLTQLNPTLQRLGWQVRYRKAEGSSRLVKLKIGEAHYEAASRFWLEAAEVPSVKSNDGIVPLAHYR